MQLTAHKNAKLKELLNASLSDWIPVVPLYDVIHGYAEIDVSWPEGKIIMPPSEVEPQPDIERQVEMIPGVLTLIIPARSSLTPEQEIVVSEGEIKKFSLNFYELYSFLMHPNDGILNNVQEFNVFLSTGKINGPKQKKKGSAEDGDLKLNGIDPHAVTRHKRKAEVDATGTSSSAALAAAAARIDHTPRKSAKRSKPNKTLH